MNKKAYRDLDYTYAEFKNFKYGDFVIYKDRSEREKLIKQLLLKGKISFQAKHKKKNGEIRYRNINASLLNLNDKRYIQGIIHDISEIKEKEIELQKSKEKFNELQSNIPIGMYITNLKGKFLYVNKATVNMLGYDSGEEMLKVPVLDIYYDKNKRNELIERLKHKGYINNVELQIVRKDKSVFWGLISVKTSFDIDGNPVQLDGIIQDITEKKNAELEIEKANQEIITINQNLQKQIEEALFEQKSRHQYMVQKSKLESLGELAAGIAHEINQPLGIMSLSFENLQMKILSKTTTPNYLNNKFNSIENNIKRIRQIIDHIRVFSRDQDSLVMEKINLNKVVNKALSLIGTQYSNHNINIKLDLKNNIGFTIGSNMQIEQVILNLLANAKYAIEDKATYSNETDYTKEIIIRSDSSDKNVILMIEDNGTGIDAHIISKIFDPFFTTKPEGFGTGLGLSIAYGIIKNMHGEIQVRSNKEDYTKINIFFPRFPEKD
ncbi:MAG: PAS domain S-box protein [Bacteroidales bacterium]|nr:PAS domain S-box protein [Bacteroidales bacterium]